jgi:hypothetical protein
MIPAVVVALFCLLPMFDMFFYERKQEKKVLVLVLVLNAGLYPRRTRPNTFVFSCVASFLLELSSYSGASPAYLPGEMKIETFPFYFTFVGAFGVIRVSVMYS